MGTCSMTLRQSLWLNASYSCSKASSNVRRYSAATTSTDRDPWTWPVATSTQKIPTPYQILGIDRGEKYGKHEFYRLVKLYHPDCGSQQRSSEPGKGLSATTMAERYRLIVEAHEILQDPVRRAAYDRDGSGWGASSDNGFRSSPYPSRARYRRTDTGDPNSPFRNATWEDWERWRHRQQREPPVPIYVSNAAFVGFILAFAVVGGMMQSVRVNSHTSDFFEREQQAHTSMSQQIHSRRAENRARDERINTFLRERGAWAYARLDAAGVDHDKHLPAPAICSSEQIHRGKG